MTESHAMTVMRGFAVTIASGLGFTFTWGLIGSTLARSVPGYDRAVLATGDRPEFDAVQVGLGLGITQGFAVGLIVGSVAVLAVAVAARRKTAAGRSDGIGGGRALRRAGPGAVGLATREHPVATRPRRINETIGENRCPAAGFRRLSAPLRQFFGRSRPLIPQNRYRWTRQ